MEATERVRALAAAGLVIVAFAALPWVAGAQVPGDVTGFKLTSAGAGHITLQWPSGWVSYPAGGFEVPLRLAHGGVTPLPAPLAVTTSVADILPLDVSTACYVVGGFAGTLVHVRGNPVCVGTRVAGGVAAPVSFSIQFDETCAGPVGKGTCPAGAHMAHLSWQLPPNIPSPSGLLLVALGTGRTRVLGPQATHAFDDTGGAFACYMLFALLDDKIYGGSDIVCGAGP